MQHCNISLIAVFRLRNFYDQVVLVSFQKRKPCRWRGIYIQLKGDQLYRRTFCVVAGVVLDRYGHGHGQSHGVVGEDGEVEGGEHGCERVHVYNVQY